MRVDEGCTEVWGVCVVLYGVRVRDLEMLALIHRVGNRHFSYLLASQGAAMFTQSRYQYNSSLTSLPPTEENKESRSQDKCLKKVLDMTKG